MFGIGGFELFIILVFGFLIFGPDKLPEIATTVGKAIAKFRSAQDEMNEVIKTTDFYDPNDTEQPFKDPTIALDKLAKHQEEKQAAKAAAEKPKAETKVDSQKPKPSEQDGSGKADPSGEEAAPKQESFSERKARYERERAARKAAEAEKAAAEVAEDGADGASSTEGGDE